MRLQLWSYNYDPEPSGIGPLSGVWARAMRARGHEVLVVAAHPHYPKSIWGDRRRPYRERRDGVPVLRLPLWVGRASGWQRVRQELSYAATLSSILPLLPRTDAIVAVTPSFPALMAAMAAARARRIPWVMWLQDILPDAAATTGLVQGGALLGAARRFELAAYASADRVVVISDAFERNLTAKGVPCEKMARIYNPSAIENPPYRPLPPDDSRSRLLVMGNIGHTQGLAEFVRAVESSNVLDRLGGELRIAGHGVAADDVADEVRSDRVRMLGLLLGQAMEDELATASVGIVSQRAGVAEFNLPSKLMNYMAHSVPVLAVVHPDSESARLVREGGAGWVLDSRRLDLLPEALERILSDPEQVRARGGAAYAMAQREFSPQRVAEQYEQLLDPLMR